MAKGQEPAQGQPSSGLTGIFSKLLQYPKQVMIGGAALFLVVLLITALSGNGNSKKLRGHWKMNPDSIGYGVSCVIDKNSIDLRGDGMNHWGHMIFKYEVVSDTELVLKYDWTFSRWVWDFPHADRIPLRYSVSEDGTMLSLYWAGTDFVLLDNISNFEMGIGSKSCLLMANGGSITLKKVQ